MKFYSAWIKVAKNRGRWLTLESEYAKTAEEDLWKMCYAEKTHNKIRPARYLNGVNLGDDEVAIVT